MDETTTKEYKYLFKFTGKKKMDVIIVITALMRTTFSAFWGRVYIQNVKIPKITLKIARKQETLEDNHNYECKLEIWPYY